MGKRILIAVFICLLFLCNNSHAYYYWMHPSGTASLVSDCRTGTAAPPAEPASSDYSKYCNSSKQDTINSTVVAGDTVYYRAGTYTQGDGTFIAPAKSGTKANPITYASYDETKAVVTGTFHTSRAVNIAGTGWNITSITKEANGVVTTATNHGLTTGDQAYIKTSASSGMTEVDRQTFTITKTGDKTFQLNVDTSAYGTFSSGTGYLVKKYIVIRNMVFESFFKFLFIDYGSGYVEVVGCTFGPQMEFWGVPYETYSDYNTGGAASMDNSTILIHGTSDTSANNYYSGLRFINLTDGFQCYIDNTSAIKMSPTGGLPSDGDQFTIHDQTFTWRNSPSATNDIQIGGTVAASLQNVRDEINGNATLSPLMTASYVSPDLATDPYVRVYPDSSAKMSACNTASSGSSLVSALVFNGDGNKTTMTGALTSTTGWFPCYANTDKYINCSTAYPAWGGTNNNNSSGDQYRVTQTRFWAGSYIYHDSTNNWIHNNTFHTYGGYSWADEGVPLEVGVGNGVTPDDSNYNTVEDNVMYNGGHHVFGFNTVKHGVVRKNYVRNESWWNDEGYFNNSKCDALENGKCGYRVISGSTVGSAGGWSTWERNKVGYGAAYGGAHLTIGASGSGVTLATAHNIFRQNELIANALYGLRFSASVSGAGIVSNRVYNNTFYKNGYGSNDDNYNSWDYQSSVYLSNISMCDPAAADHVLKNNLFYDSYSTSDSWKTFWGRSTITPPISENVTSYNNCNNNLYQTDDSPNRVSDPKFVNPDITTPSSIATLPNLALQSGSPAIDIPVGHDYGALTLTSSSGSTSTVLIVNDSTYFQDGTRGSELSKDYNGTGSYVYDADWIAVGTVGNVSRIDNTTAKEITGCTGAGVPWVCCTSSGHGTCGIDYSNNTIYLDTALTWSDNASVWLYKNSLGERVLYGTAPDYGAHENTGLADGHFTCPQGTCSKFLNWVK